MKKNSHETIAGLFVLVGIILLVYMTVKLGDVSILGDDSYALSAGFETVSGLRAGNPVEMQGIDVGMVESLKLDQDKQIAVVILKIRKNYIVYSDAIASIKTAGLIGDKYVSLDPGGSEKVLQNGGIIINTESPVDIGDLIGKYAFGSIDKEDTLDEEIK